MFSFIHRGSAKFISKNKLILSAVCLLLFFLIHPISARNSPFILPRGTWVESGTDNDITAILNIREKNLIELSKPNIENRILFEAVVLGSVDNEYTVIVKKREPEIPDTGEDEKVSESESDPGNGGSDKTSDEKVDVNHDSEPESENLNDSEMFAGSSVYSILSAGKTWIILNKDDGSLRFLQPSGSSAPEVILKRK
jgi:hypothetical protein